MGPPSEGGSVYRTRAHCNTRPRDSPAARHTSRVCRKERVARQSDELPKDGQECPSYVRMSVRDTALSFRARRTPAARAGVDFTGLLRRDQQLNAEPAVICPGLDTLRKIGTLGGRDSSFQ